MVQKDSLSPVMQKDSFCERGADCGGYASGGVPVTAVLGVVLFSLYGVGTGHARFDRSKNSTFGATAWPSSDLEAGECTDDFERVAALRNLSIVFGYRFTTPSCVLRTPFTTGPGGPLP